MPINYLIDTAKGIIRTRCIGNATFAEVLEHFSTLVQDPACRDRLDVLLDLSEMTSVPDSHQLRDVSSEIGSIRHRVQFGACAVVANKDVLFGMSRMFQVFAERQFQNISVFRTLAEAEVWLCSEASPPHQQTAEHG